MFVVSHNIKVPTILLPQDEAEEENWLDLLNMDDFEVVDALEDDEDQSELGCQSPWSQSGILERESRKAHTSSSKTGESSKSREHRRERSKSYSYKGVSKTYDKGKNRDSSRRYSKDDSRKSKTSCERHKKSYDEKRSHSGRSVSKHSSSTSHQLRRKQDKKTDSKKMCLTEKNHHRKDNFQRSITKDKHLPISDKREKPNQSQQKLIKGINDKHIKLGKCSCKHISDKTNVKLIPQNEDQKKNKRKEDVDNNFSKEESGTHCEAVNISCEMSSVICDIVSAGSKTISDASENTKSNNNTELIEAFFGIDSGTCENLYNNQKIENTDLEIENIEDFQLAKDEVLEDYSIDEELRLIMEYCEDNDKNFLCDTDYVKQEDSKSKQTDEYLKQENCSLKQTIEKCSNLQDVTEDCKQHYSNTKEEDPVSKQENSKSKLTLKDAKQDNWKCNQAVVEFEQHSNNSGQAFQKCKEEGVQRELESKYSKNNTEQGESRLTKDVKSQQEQKPRQEVRGLEKENGKYILENKMLHHKGLDSENSCSRVKDKVCEQDYISGKKESVNFKHEDSKIKHETGTAKYSKQETAFLKKAKKSKAKTEGSKKEEKFQKVKDSNQKNMMSNDHIKPEQECTCFKKLTGNSKQNVKAVNNGAEDSKWHNVKSQNEMTDSELSNTNNDKECQKYEKGKINSMQGNQNSKCNESDVQRENKVSTDLQGGPSEMEDKIGKYIEAVRKEFASKPKKYVYLEDEVCKKVIGSSCLQKKKVVIIGDSRIKSLAEVGMDGKRFSIDIRCVPDLTLDKLKESVELYVDKKYFSEGILLICSVGIYDIIEISDNLSCQIMDDHVPMKQIYFTKRNSRFDIIHKMMAVRSSLQDLLGNNSEVYFTTILPVNISKFNLWQLKVHKDGTGHHPDVQSPSPRLENLVYHKLTEVNDEVKKLSVRGDGRTIPWHLLEINESSQSAYNKFSHLHMVDGLNPSKKLTQLSIIPFLKNRINLYSMRYQEVVLIGDSRIQALEKAWPTDTDNTMLTVLTQSKLSFHTFTQENPIVKEITGKKNSLIVISLGMYDLLNFVAEDGCDSHEIKLELPSLCIETLDSTNEAWIDFVHCLKRVDQLLHKITINCDVIITTIYPFDFLSFKNYLIKMHAEKTGHVIQSQKQSEELDKKLCQISDFILRINRIATAYSKRKNLPVWDFKSSVFGKCSQLASDVPLFDGFHPVSSIARKIAGECVNFAKQSYYASIHTSTLWNTNDLADFERMPGSCIYNISNLLDRNNFLLSLSPEASSLTAVKKSSVLGWTPPLDLEDMKTCVVENASINSSCNLGQEPTYNNVNMKDSEKTKKRKNTKESSPCILQAITNKRKNGSKDFDDCCTFIQDNIYENCNPSRHCYLEGISPSTLSSSSNIETGKHSPQRENFENYDIFRKNLDLEPVSPSSLHLSSPDYQNPNEKNSNETDSDSRYKLSGNYTVNYTDNTFTISKYGTPDLSPSRYHSSPKCSKWLDRHTNRGIPSKRRYSSEEELTPERELSPWRCDSKVRHHSGDRCYSTERICHPNRSNYSPESRWRERSVSPIWKRGVSPVSRCSSDRNESWKHSPRSCSPLRRSVHTFSDGVSKERLRHDRRHIALTPDKGSPSTLRSRRSQSRRSSRFRWSRGRRDDSDKRTSLVRALRRSRSRTSSRSCSSKERRDDSDMRACLVRAFRRSRSRTSSRSRSSRGRREDGGRRTSLVRAFRRSRSRSRWSRGRDDGDKRTSLVRTLRRPRSQTSSRSRSSRERRDDGGRRTSLMRALRRSRSRTSSRSRSSRGRRDNGEEKNGVVVRALQSLHEVHNRECAMYRKNPLAHPDYTKEYQAFVEKKRKKILSLGGDPYTYNMTKDWEVFWKSRLETLFNESWTIKRDQCVSLLPINKLFPRSPSSSSSSFVSSSSSSDARHFKSRNYQRKRAKYSRSPSVEIKRKLKKRKRYNERRRGSDKSRDCEAKEIQRQEKKDDTHKGHIRKEDRSDSYRNSKLPSETSQGNDMRTARVTSTLLDKDVRTARVPSTPLDNDRVDNRKHTLAVNKVKSSSSILNSTKQSPDSHIITDKTYEKNSLKTRNFRLGYSPEKSECLSRKKEQMKDYATNCLPEEEVSSTTPECFTTDVIDVLETLGRLGEKLGALLKPVMLLHEKALKLKSSGLDTMKIFDEIDNKILLHMIGDKLRNAMKSETLNIIQKVIIQEAEQRLTFLLEREKDRSLLYDLNIESIASACLGKTSAETITFIENALFYHGHTDVPQEQLMKIDLAVKAEQAKTLNLSRNVSEGRDCVASQSSQFPARPESKSHHDAVLPLQHTNFNSDLFPPHHLGSTSYSSQISNSPLSTVPSAPLPPPPPPPPPLQPPPPPPLPPPLPLPVPSPVYTTPQVIPQPVPPPAITPGSCNFNPSASGKGIMSDKISLTEFLSLMSSSTGMDSLKQTDSSESHLKHALSEVEDKIHDHYPSASFTKDSYTTVPSHNLQTSCVVSASHLINPSRSQLAKKQHVLSSKTETMKPIKITLPKVETQKNFARTFNPLGDEASENEES
ncbi:uncharacterized protein [Cherax quadricarinatus]|uniref:uncharacterized protein isoform X3 n=1 Tax=Cherax quadricarinatus TaxID=27406 RepID=UPI00387E6BC5